MRIHNAFRFGLLGGLGVLVALAIGNAVVDLRQILTYIFAALFLALGLDPLVSWLESKHIKRPIAIVIVLVLVLAVFAGLVLALIPVVSDQVTLLINQIPFIISGFRNDVFVDAIESALPWIDMQQVLSTIQTQVQSADFIQGLTGGVLAVAVGIGTGVTGALIVLILMIYFISSVSGLKRGLYQLVPASKRKRVADITEQITQSVGRYVVGQVTLALFNGVLSFVFLTFVFRVQYSALLAFIAFLGSLIPLVGTITASIIISLAVLLFNGTPTVFFVAVYYLIYMQVEAYVLNPRIMNRAVQVPGVIVVIAALVGGSLASLLGALVAIPVAASILIIVKQVFVPRQNAL